MYKYFIRMLVACAFGWVGIFSVAATAHASLIEFEGSYEVDLSQASSDPGLVINTSNHNDGLLNFILGDGDIYVVDLFDIWTDESFVNSDDQVPQDIEVNFSFTLPEIFFGTSQGQTVGQSTTILGFINIQTGTVGWNNPTSLDFGNGGILEISLSDETFNTGFFGLFGSQHFGATVTGTFTVAKAPSEVPEPGVLALFGLGLLGMGGIVRHRQRAHC